MENIIVAEEDTQLNDIFTQFEDVIEKITVFRTQINGLQQQIRLLEKSVKKQVKGLKKEVVKNKRKGNRKPSGFATPTKVTKELCDFMNKKEGTEIARTEVTQALVSYIKEHKLENEENSKYILPDDKLKVLLGLCDGDEVTYFNIQKYMNKHFIKKTESTDPDVQV